jgi:hypothetical protein
MLLSERHPLQKIQIYFANLIPVQQFPRARVMRTEKSTTGSVYGEVL